MHLWLHVGSHKTGTTSIQVTCAGSRQALEATGLSYPKNYLNLFYTIRKNAGHHYIAQATARGELQQHLKAIRKHTRAGEVLLSSERFDYVPQMKIRDLPVLLGEAFDSVTVILYLREPVSLAISRSAQRLKRGLITYEELSADPPLYNYRASVSKWTNAFGRENVRLRVFSQKTLVNGDAVDDLLSLTGRNADRIALKRNRKNDGITLQAALAISERKRADPDFKPQRQARELFGLPGDRFTLPLHTQAHILEKSVPDLVWLKRHHGIEFYDAPTAHKLGLGSEFLPAIDAAARGAAASGRNNSLPA